MEGAAEGDIQFLIAATDRQQRNALLESEADQRQAGGVARRIKGFGLDGCRPAIVAGMHVGRAAGHHDAVERADQAAQVDQILAQRGDRSEARRGGKEWVSTGRARWTPYRLQKKVRKHKG